jgi:hypothetical protein
LKVYTVARYDSAMHFEYMVREFSVQEAAHIVLLEDFLNEVGKDGWDLVSVAVTPTAAFTHVVYLKRATVLAKLPGMLE